MNCEICKKDSKKHSQKLWQMHKDMATLATLGKKQLCTLCSKSKELHSEKLWEMHDAVIRKGVFYSGNGLSDGDQKDPKWSGERAISPGMKHGKIWPIQEGFGPKRPGMVVDTVSDPRERPVIIPIHSSCRECGLFVGEDEEDNADVLDGMCMKCFCEQTGQEYTWHTVTPTFEEMQRRMEAKV